MRIENTIDIDAPLDLLWARTLDVESWVAVEAGQQVRAGDVDADVQTSLFRCNDRIRTEP
jgi:hypothetical protein